LSDFDVLIVGGGINGCGIARDAAGRGYSVLLAEKADLASGTSSSSTKLIHGGLRYLENYEFRLVREALAEREVLWANAPHIVWPLRFVLPYQRGLRPAWMLRLGLFLYDHIGGRRQLPGTKTLDLRGDVAGRPLKPGFERAFEYSDCWVEDSRLVVLNARDAAARGAEIHTRCAVSRAVRGDDGWRVTLGDGETAREVTARLLVNAAGPWVEDILQRTLERDETDQIRLVQGSHIVVRRIFDHDRCYIFQNPDGRIIFAIPYETDFTLIGTTDQDYVGDPAKVAITDAEIDYLCTAVSEYFTRAVTRDDIVWSYSGVRPLHDDGAGSAQETTRDYVVKLESDPAPLVNVFGGKITTYRRLAESVLDMVGEVLGARGQPWTAKAPLPGGDFPMTGFDALFAATVRTHPRLPPATLRRLVRAYGTDAGAMLAGATLTSDLGRHFGAGLHQREVDFLIEREWARSAEDILWRRSKLGLHFDDAGVAALDAYVRERVAGQAVDAPDRETPLAAMQQGGALHA
jgi:glycerol-3-phosphate dehydrogenase